MKIPDAIEPAVGFRVWLVEPTNYTLHSINHQAIWSPDTPFEAYCTHDHEPPGEKCTCGVYAANSFNRLFDMGYTKDAGLFSVSKGEVSVAGEVSMWGGIVPGTQGWRCQFAYPKKFLIPYTLWKLARPLSEQYHVPYQLYNLERKH